MQRKAQEVEWKRRVAETLEKQEKYEIEGGPEKSFCREDIVAVVQPHKKDVIVAEKGQLQEGKIDEQPANKGRAGQDRLLRFLLIKSILSLAVGF
jgi:hypothetical protein